MQGLSVQPKSNTFTPCLLRKSHNLKNHQALHSSARQIRSWLDIEKEAAEKHPERAFWRLRPAIVMYSRGDSGRVGYPPKMRARDQSGDK